MDQLHVVAERKNLLNILMQNLANRLFVFRLKCLDILMGIFTIFVTFTCHAEL